MILVTSNSTRAPFGSFFSEATETMYKFIKEAEKEVLNREQSGYNFYHDEKGRKINALKLGTKEFLNFNGYKKTDIKKAEIVDNILEIAFKKNEDSSKYVVERSHYFELPKDADKDKVSIELKDGILAITIEEAEKQVTKVQIL